MQVKHFIYLGAVQKNKAIYSEGIISKICKRIQIIGCLNSLWWDKNIYLWRRKKKNS